jgi:heterodisulfide reductase subunit A
MKDTAKTALVIGAGPAGIEAALKIGQAGFNVLLIEKEKEIGGYMRKLCSSFPRWENPQKLLELKTMELEKNPNIKLLTDTTLVSCDQSEESYSVNLVNNGGYKSINAKVDAAVLTTGFDLFDASVYGEYGYGIYPGVMDSLEFENQLKVWSANKDKAEAPQAIAFFKCVGSRDRSKGNPYCSKICCMYTAKQAGLVKELFPETKCYVFYMDYRSAGKEYEEFVRSVIEDRHVRYVRGRVSKVVPQNSRLLVRTEDTLMGLPVEVEVDKIVLANGVVPRKETVKLAEIFGVTTDRYGFVEPVFGSPAKAGDRVFFAGGCNFAVELPGAQYQGAAAAAEVIGLFYQDERGGK